MKKQILIAVFAGILQPYFAKAFCGFYVAKADARLFNKASQVIIAKSEDRFVVTMSNDFSGEVKDFAMVVPVPEVPEKQDIRTVNRLIFDKLDAYSGPRLVEYYDHNPCNRYVMESVSAAAASMADARNERRESEERLSKKEGVSIVAKYAIGEYDILILDAKQSSGLESWLIRNGYRIPEGAKEVLEPYIKSNMKFFVAKVNLENFNSSGYSLLNPIQISYSSPKFMLPIRLGMANAKDDQDLVIYMITRKGRAEVTNYRTVEIPTDKNVPEFVEQKFGKFYKDLFNRAWKREGKNVAFLEYSWDISSSNQQKCDPCAAPPPVMNELAEAGAFWLERSAQTWGGGYSGNAWFTRLHLRYNRESFPQDLFFQETPNRQSFQARYIITHPAQGDLDCTDGGMYMEQLIGRRQKELQVLASLTGWDIEKYDSYVSKYRQKLDLFKEDHILKNGIQLPDLDSVLENLKWLYLLAFLLLTFWLTCPLSKNSRH